MSLQARSRGPFVGVHGGSAREKGAGYDPIVTQKVCDSNYHFIAGYVSR